MTLWKEFTAYCAAWSIGAIALRLLAALVVGIVIGVDRGIKRRGAGTFVKDLNMEEMEKIMMANQFRGTTAINAGKEVVSKVLNFSVIRVPEDVANVEAALRQAGRVPV